MMKKRDGIQQKMIVTTIEQLMPNNHFLRELDKIIDFDFIYDIVKPLYSTTGRPSVDPVVIIKIMLLGYLYGINSERQLEKEIEVNIAYRWFLGIDLDEPVPDHSTLSQLRRRKLKNSNVFEEIFTKIVTDCIQKGFVDGKLLLTDSTHVKANARDEKAEIITVEITPSDYIKRINKEAEELGLCNNVKKLEEVDFGTKEVRKSLTDPESGFMRRPGKPLGFHYLSHQTCDGKNGLITDVHVTAGNVQDATVHSERICYQIGKFNLDTKAVCADAGYASGEIHKDMLERNIQTYIPQKAAPAVIPDRFTADEFKLDKENNVLICPNNKTLKFMAFSSKNGCNRYNSKSKDCKDCTLRNNCISQTAKYRSVLKSFHKHESELQCKAQDSPDYLRAMRLRKIFCEGNFAHQKARHNLARVNKIGVDNARIHCLLSACAFNLKRMVKLSFA